MKCDHTWKDLSKRDSRSYQDRICIKCGEKQMQNAMALPLTESTVKPNIKREEMHTVHLDTQTKVDISVEDFKRTLSREMYQGLGVSQSSLGINN